MATAMSPVDARVVVRCDLCFLVQFPSTSNLCRRCKRSLEPEPVPAPRAAPPLPVAPTLATTLRELRLRAGISQRQLAARMPVPRSYVSKLENEKVTPTLWSLERVARALGVTASEVLERCEHRSDESRAGLRSELLCDPFVASLLPHVRSLTGMQRQAVIAEVSALASRARAA